MASDGSPAPPTRPLLIGRTDELTRLRDIADRSVEEGAQMVLLSGDAGIGKSSLTTMFLEQLAEVGWSGHVGHCIEYADRPLPFGPIVAILRSMLLDNLDRVDDVVGHHRDDLAGLLPELNDEASNGSSLAGDVDRLFDAISTTFIGAARRRPMVVVVEDIHWADAATRDLLSSMVHSLGSARILLIVTERSAAVGRGHPLRTWLAELRRFTTVHSLELEGLSRDELTEQASAILGHEPDQGLLDELIERTEGNAYFSRELLMARREGSNELPTSLVAFLTSRLDRLADEEREVLRAVAVAGGVISHPILAAMLPDLNVGPIVRRLFDESILALDDADYRFGHALLREAILRDVLPFEAEELHRRAAEAILADPRRGTSLADLASLAMHWDHANDVDRSLAAATKAADAAAAVAAYETAAELSLQALRAWPLASAPEERTGLQRDQLLLNAADWLTSCFRGEEAVTLVSEALETWAAALPAGRRALLLARISFVVYNLARPTEAVAILHEAEQLVGDEVSAEAAQVHHRVSKQAVADGQIEPARAAAERAIAIATTEGPPVVLVEALATKALALGVGGDLHSGVALAREARELARSHGLHAQMVHTYRTEWLIHYFIEGRTEAGFEAMRAGLEYAEQHCGPRLRGGFRLDLCLGYVESGRLEDAQPLFGPLLSSKLDDLRRLEVLHTSALYGFELGDLALSESFLSEARELAERYQSAQETGLYFRLAAELARRQGRLDDAVELIDKALKLQLQADNLTYTRESIVEKVRIVGACAEAGRDIDDQRAEVEQLVAGFDGAGIANEAMRALMELELAAIDHTADAERADRAIDLLARSGMGYEAARARLTLVEVLMGGGASTRDRLEAELVDLHAVTSANGIRWIADRVAALAGLAHVQLDDEQVDETPAPASEPAELPHHLTTREVEVMSLLAEGLTNKGIGERLYVSPRTVSTHISNLLAKLGVSSRGEAAAAYHRLGLAEVIDLRTDAEADVG